MLSHVGYQGSKIRDLIALKFHFADRFPYFANTLSLFADFIFF